MNPSDQRVSNTSDVQWHCQQCQATESARAEELDPENTLTNAIANGEGRTLTGECTWTSRRGRRRSPCENESDAVGTYEQADFTEGDRARKLIEGTRNPRRRKGKLIGRVDPGKAAAAKTGRRHRKYREESSCIVLHVTQFCHVLANSARAKQRSVIFLMSLEGR